MDSDYIPILQSSVLDVAGQCEEDARRLRLLPERWEVSLKSSSDNHQDLERLLRTKNT